MHDEDRDGRAYANFTKDDIRSLLFCLTSRLGGDGVVLCRVDNQVRIDELVAALLDRLMFF
jgi:hypothetical protein